MSGFIKSSAEINFMREGGCILAEVLEVVKQAAQPGIATLELDRLAHNEVTKRGARPAFLGYNGFPASICISINEEVVHGIPGVRKLEEGDVVKLDLGVTHHGLITDAAISVVVGGKMEPRVRQLLDATESALAAGCAAARSGSRVGDVGAAIEHVLEWAGFSVIEELCGHGVGYKVHEDPSVPNFGRPGTGMRLQPGMTLAIEPMASLGGKDVGLAPDGWTYFTRDHSLAAQFEHTVAVTDVGGEILTKAR